ncbi:MULTISPECIES: dimethylargininase [unclassified Mycolicibacterium]|uniref:dimethylargininase n=1 Tax=unclassified Mycolicibacterium TaxID=2636767 RepID=UPI0012DF86A0|nr:MULTISPECIES: dimethylargininase [unclassified Mycolicibacterium]MUL81470.1 N-dimethylarginine dimethylaminohydrolase [Mycolicibacterium sp. CBMA 329]MUL87236.1 N-dimethylarginine dimethylaminohydrolase [Mycolicibacterium sp. CBMA 331]MUL98482.1 N-dimethylarginine dimethylaminohydrolase [Mycolicibacterium sp. CBMA 334]MUM25238.1 N-dimethylarginine dimethylaminohydrolase [Mycolicibacterium sp. CBMA 295]MUM37533.1 N-dimethylarginine dimethylaminohydrolase [Mycolicibacterium sp. CBMA 247]
MTISGEVMPDAMPKARGAASRTRTAATRHYAMTAPEYFTVEYAINPWMDTSTPVDTALALAQWDALRGVYADLGHTVELVTPRNGLPDMVYAANGGFVVGDTAVVARFAYPQRAAEADAYAEWMSAHGYRPVHTEHVNEGQGDLLLVGSNLLAGYGFRTDRRAHDEIAAATGLAVTSLELVDPRFYHLDTALAVLDDSTIAYYPPAFSADARRRLAELFGEAIEVSSADAYVLGLNVVSDGRHVVMPSAATGFADQLRRAGFEPIGVDLSELLKGGGSVKCCTLELHR